MEMKGGRRERGLTEAATPVFSELLLMLGSPVTGPAPGRRGELWGPEVFLGSRVWRPQWKTFTRRPWDGWGWRTGRRAEGRIWFGIS